MSTQLRAVAYRAGEHPVGPVHRSIVAVDLEGSTTRSNPVKGELRQVMYNLLDRSLDAVRITDDHLEPPIDRGDGVLLLIRPNDDVPKTVLLGRLIPLLTALLTEHNEAVISPASRMRLRAVVHAGEIHGDSKGFYGEAIDVAIRLLDSAPLKSALRQIPSPLALVVSDEIYSGIVAHGYLDGDSYRPLVRVRVANKQHCGWVHIPQGQLASKAGLSAGGEAPLPVRDISGALSGENVASTTSQLPGRGKAAMPMPWTRLIAWTVDRPRPSPPVRFTDLAPSRWKGLNRRAT
jgi:hypothetical protein